MIDCYLFNAMPIPFCGNETLTELLHLLIAGELLFVNAWFYANHDAFNEKTRAETGLPLNTLFALALTRHGDKKLLDTGNKVEAVKAEALKADTKGEWSSFMHILVLSSVVSKPVNSMYPNVNLRFPILSLIYRSIHQRAALLLSQASDTVEPRTILWSRNRNFNVRPGTWFISNHCIPVISEEGSV